MTLVDHPRIAFVGDRAISIRCLEYLLERDIQPVPLLVGDGPGASHADELRAVLIPSSRKRHGWECRLDLAVRPRVVRPKSACHSHMGGRSLDGTGTGGSRQL